MVDSGLMIAAERRRLSPDDALKNIRRIVGEIPLILSAVSAAEDRPRYLPRIDDGDAGAPPSLP